MKLKLATTLAGAAILVACAAGAQARGAGSLPLIRGGTAAQLGDLPSLVFVAYLIPNGKNEAITCTGTVVAPRLVLTAAHCVQVPSVRIETENFRVVTGVVNWKAADRTVLHVVKIEISPGYNARTGHGDAALLELEAPVSAPPISLARRPFWAAGTEAEIAGWGRIHPGQHDATYLLHRGPTTLLGYADCREAGGVTGQLCVEQSPPQKTSPCYGDSGGPLLAHRPGDHRLVEIGVLHGGAAAGCSPRYAGIYTSTVPIHHWIKAREAEAAVRPS